QLSYLLKLKKVFLQGFFFGQAGFVLGQTLLGQAGAGGAGGRVILVCWTVLLRAEKPANARQLLQPLEAADKQDPGQLNEFLEQTIATLGFKELALDFGKLLLDFEVVTAGLLRLTQKGEGIKIEIG